MAGRNREVIRRHWGLSNMKGKVFHLFSIALSTILKMDKRRQMENEKWKLDANGQALITLLFFAIIGITVTTAAAALMVVSAKSGTKLQQSSLAYEVAESGADNAELRLLRDPTYGGETITVGGGTATISVVNNAGTYTITSNGVVGNFSRTIQITASYVNNVFTISSIGEVY